MVMFTLSFLITAYKAHLLDQIRLLVIHQIFIDNYLLKCAIFV